MLRLHCVQISNRSQNSQRHPHDIDMKAYSDPACHSILDCDVENAADVVLSATTSLLRRLSVGGHSNLQAPDSNRDGRAFHNLWEVVTGVIKSSSSSSQPSI